jgi:GMP synthase (glutamine-hydrolysing)
MEYVRTFFEGGKPMLGVCYSHQLIARSLAGQKAVGKAAVPEVTYAPIEILKEHPIFKGLPNPFRVMSSHYDQVCRPPEGFDVFACSKDCPIQMMIHQDKPVVGMQFHPEMDIGEGKKSLFGEWEKLKGFGLDPNVLLAQFPGHRTGAEAVLTNFIKFVS